MLAILMSGCAINSAPPDIPKETRLQNDLALKRQLDEIHRMQNLVEESLVLRSKAINFYQSHALKEKQAGHDLPLTYDELSRLYDNSRYYLDIREKLRAIALKSSWLANPNNRVIFNRQDKNDANNETIRKTPTPNKKQLVFINLQSIEGRLLMLQLKTSLGAALVLYDNYLMGIYPFTKNKKFSYLFNRDFFSYLTDEANKYSDKNILQKLGYKIRSFAAVNRKLDELTNSYLNGSQRDKILAAINIIDAYNDIEKFLPDDPIMQEEAYLDLLIKQSYTYNLIRKQGKFVGDPTPYRRSLSQLKENLIFFRNAFSFIVSEGFGNGVGLVAVRKGKLKNLSAAEKKKIADSLQPLDILLEKTPFRLTDVFIPGHWGHVAVWVGSYNDFAQLGLSDHPLVKKYQDQLKNGRSIVEALRAGVQINSLEHFLNIDDLLILRAKNLSLAEKKLFLLNALEQVGKEYDFNFNVETQQAIVCSELAYVVFKNVTWPAQKNLGRFTISPDHVAKKALDGTFKIVLLYHDGKKVDKNVYPTLSSLLNASSSDHH